MWISGVPRISSSTARAMLGQRWREATASPCCSSAKAVSRMRWRSCGQSLIALDQLGTVGGISGKHQLPVRTVEPVGHRGDGMAGRQRGDAAPAAIAALADVDRMEAHEGLVVVGNRGKIGPHQPVEDVRVQDADGLGRRMHLHRRLAQFAHRVDHQRQRGDVVEVRMGEEDVVDPRQLVQRQVADARPAVDQDVVVEQERGGARLRPADSAAAPQHLELHGLRHPASAAAGGHRANPCETLAPTARRPRGRMSRPPRPLRRAGRTPS